MLLKPNQTVFVGVIDPLNPIVETPEVVRDRVLEAAAIVLPAAQLGTTDDCGFSPSRRRRVHRPRHSLQQNPRKNRRNRTRRSPTRLLSQNIAQEYINLCIDGT